MRGGGRLSAPGILTTGGPIAPVLLMWGRYLMERHVSQKGLNGRDDWESSAHSWALFGCDGLLADDGWCVVVRGAWWYAGYGACLGGFGSVCRWLVGGWVLMGVEQLCSNLVHEANMLQQVAKEMCVSFVPTCIQVAGMHNVLAEKVDPMTGCFVCSVVASLVFGKD